MAAAMQATGGAEIKPTVVTCGREVETQHLETQPDVTLQSRPEMSMKLF